MRLVASFDHEQQARRFSLFLQKEEIENTLEMQLDNKKDKFSYSIWVHDEDKLELASNYLQEFLKDPNDHKYDVSLKEIIKEEPQPELNEDEDYEKLKKIIPSKDENKKPPIYILTGFFFALCVLVFLISFMQQNTLKQKNAFLPGYQFTPIQLALLYDVPKDLEEFNEQIPNLEINYEKPLDEQPQILEFVEKFEKQPKGLYDLMVLKLKNPKMALPKLPEMFVKIKQGEVYRLISPCILHGGFLHIIFNMLWLWVLGKQIEERISKLKYLLLVIIVGVISNTLQYLMSGPYFLGFSGIIMGMVGFIWGRQKIAPWEGYPLQRIVFLFLMFYILAILALQIFTFVMQVFFNKEFYQMIANTAHISGAIAGWVLGRMSFFSWRPIEH